MAFRGSSEAPRRSAGDAGSAIARQSQPSRLRTGRRSGQCVLAGVVAVWLVGVASAVETVTYILRPVPQAGRLEVELSWKTKGRKGSALEVSKRWGAIDNVPKLLSNVRFEGASALPEVRKYAYTPMSRSAWFDSTSVGSGPQSAPRRAMERESSAIRLAIDLLTLREISHR